MQKQCLVCGNTFDKKENVSKKNWELSKFCSRKCSLEKTAIKFQAFEPRTDLVAWNKGRKYSPDEISRMNMEGLQKGRGLSKGMKKPEFSGKNHPNWKEPMISHCEYCGKAVERKPWQLKRHVYCNLICSRAGIRGKNSPVFMGENAKNSLRQRIMQLPEYVAWRKLVFARDGFKCVWCGATSGFEADHIKAFKIVRDENNIKTPEDARMCKELWDVSNGRTLCRACHRKTDSYPKNLLNNNSKFLL